MVKISTSYFYKIRFFKPWMVPLSTAVFDPKWWRGRGIFKDKNGVLNGLKIPPFMPGEACEGLCHGPQNCLARNQPCEFLSTYKRQLDKLDYNNIMDRFNSLAQRIKEKEQIDHDIEFVLIFYEKPDNPCSERVMVHKWFQEHGYPITEWEQ